MQDFWLLITQNGDKEINSENITVLMYHKAVLLKFLFVALLSLQIFSVFRIIIKGRDEPGCWLI